MRQPEARYGRKPGAGARPRLSLRLARVEDIPDQLVGSLILEVVYRRLDIAVEFVDMPAKRALVESSQGRVGGEVQRLLDVGREYPSLIAVQPSINYIEPVVFVKRLDFRVAGWGHCTVLDRNRAGRRLVGARDARDGQGSGRDLDGSVDGHVGERSGRSGGQRPIQRAAGRQATPSRDGDPAPVPGAGAHRLYHFLNERHRDLVPRVGKVIEDMAASGELERLREEFTMRMIGAAGQ